MSLIESLEANGIHVCTKCKIAKSEDKFYPSRLKHRSFICRDCANALSRKYSQTEQFRAYHRNYQRTHPAKGRTQARNFSLDEMLQRYDLLSYREEAIKLTNGLSRGRSLRNLSAAICIYLNRKYSPGACLNLDDLSCQYDVPMKILSRDLRLLIKQSETSLPLPNMEACLSRLFGKFQVSPETEQWAMKAVPHTLLQGKPMGRAAAALYYAMQKTGESRTSQREIAEASNISDVGLRKHLREIEKNIEVKR